MKKSIYSLLFLSFMPFILGMIGCTDTSYINYDQPSSEQSYNPYKARVLHSMATSFIDFQKQSARPSSTSAPTANSSVLEQAYADMLVFRPSETARETTYSHITQAFESFTKKEYIQANSNTAFEGRITDWVYQASSTETEIYQWNQLHDRTTQSHWIETKETSLTHSTHNQTHICATVNYTAGHQLIIKNANSFTTTYFNETHQTISYSLTLKVNNPHAANPDIYTTTLGGSIQTDTSDSPQELHLSGVITDQYNQAYGTITIFSDYTFTIDPNI